MHLYMIIQGLLLSLPFKLKLKSVMYASIAHYQTFCLLLSQTWIFFLIIRSKQGLEKMYGCKQIIQGYQIRLHSFFHFPVLTLP